MDACSIFERDTAERLDVGPSSTVVLVPGSATGGRLSVVEMHLDGGWAGPPPHVHARIDHLWCVVGGELDITVGDRQQRIRTGGWVFVPAGCRHGFSTEHTGRATLLEVDTPQALDGYFRDLAEAFAPGAVPDPLEVVEVMARHDTLPWSPIEQVPGSAR